MLKKKQNKTETPVKDDAYLQVSNASQSAAHLLSLWVSHLREAGPHIWVLKGVKKDLPGELLCLLGTCYFLYFLKHFPRITLGTWGGSQGPHVKSWASSPTASPDIKFPFCRKHHRKVYKNKSGLQSWDRKVVEIISTAFPSSSSPRRATSK